MFYFAIVFAARRVLLLMPQSLVTACNLKVQKHLQNQQLDLVQPVFDLPVHTVAHVCLSISFSYPVVCLS